MQRHTRFWICLNMAELCLDKLLTVAGLWIWLVKVSQAFEYDSGSEQQDSEFARVTQCAEYVLKCLIMPEYIQINSSRYARILNVSDAVQSVRSLYKLLSSYWSRRLFRHCHWFYDGASYEKNDAWVLVRNFSGGFMELGHFDKHIVENTTKKDPTWKHFGAFSPRWW